MPVMDTNSASGFFGTTTAPVTMPNSFTPSQPTSTPAITSFGFGANGTNSFTPGATTGFNAPSTSSSTPSTTSFGFGPNGTGQFTPQASGGIGSSGTTGFGTSGPQSVSGNGAFNGSYGPQLPPGGVDTSYGPQLPSGNSGTTGSSTSSDSSTGGTPSVNPGSGTDLSSMLGMGGSGGTSTSGETGFLDNPLNPYAQVAYHWRFFTTGDNDGGGEVVIAETGKTGFNIRSAQMTGLIGPNAVSHNTNMTRFKMTIAEATGVSFLDGLYTAVNSAGVKNWQKAFYWIELYFMGYQETGAPVQIITEGMPNNGKLKWKIRIVNIDTHLDASGSIYTLDCLIMHDLDEEKGFMNTQETYKVEADTVADFFTKLTEKLNKSVQDKYRAPVATYAFKFHKGPDQNTPDPSQWKLKPDNTAKADSFRMFSMEEGQREKQTANLTRGTVLTKLVEDIIGVTKEGQALGVHGDASKDPSTPPEAGAFRDTVVYRAYPEVTFTGYHKDSGQYAKNITIHVKPFKTQATTLKSPETNTEADAASISQKAWQSMAPRCRKKYEYIFTGLNTEVINFDIKFDVIWAATLPRLDGWNYYNEQIEHHAIYDKEGVEKAKQATQAQGQGNAIEPLGGGGGGGGQFVEDLLANAGQGNTPYALISTVQGAEGPRRANGTGMLGQRGSRGRSLYGALLDQMYDTRALQKIDIDIKGDPWWLGGQYENMFKDGSQDKGSPDYSLGDSYFLLTFRYPYGVHEETGQPQFKQENVFNGIYRIIEVTADFADGKFTMKLSAIRIPKVSPVQAAQLAVNNQSFAGNGFNPGGFNTVNPGQPLGNGSFGLNGVTSGQPSTFNPGSFDTTASQPSGGSGSTGSGPPSSAVPTTGGTAGTTGAAVPGVNPSTGVGVLGSTRPGSSYFGLGGVTPLSSVIAR